MKTKLQIRATVEGSIVNFHFRRNGKNVHENSLTPEEKGDLSIGLFALSYILDKEAFSKALKEYLKHNSLKL